CRTNAQRWVEAEAAGRPPDDLPPGEQFADLRDWLELGLARLEIEAVKARGVGQLLAQAEHAIAAVRPPDLSAEAEKVRAAWDRVLEQEAEDQADVLVGTLEPYQNEVEHHFSVQGQQRFRGLMAGYLRVTTKLRYVGSTLRDKVPLAPRIGSRVQTPEAWDLGEFVQSCARVAGERVLGQRTTALVNRLLVEADQRGFPLALLNDRTAETARLDWEQRTTRAVVDALTEVERQATRPTGWRKYLRGAVGLLGNVLPELVLVGSIIVILYLFIVEQWVPSLAQMLIPLYMTLGVLVLMHVVILTVLPVRWAAIRGEFRSRLAVRLRGEFGRT